MEDKQTILKLYENFINDIYSMSKEKLEINKRISEEQEKLNVTLTDEQKELIDNIKILENESHELVNRDTFVFAYQLATKLIIESLEGNNKDN